MLSITAINLTGLVNDKPCDYEVSVRINLIEIWNGVVTGHMRADGWTMLLRQIADQAESGDGDFKAAD